jgi:hypothetical protein
LFGILAQLGVALRARRVERKEESEYHIIKERRKRVLYRNEKHGWLEVDLGLERPIRWLN